MRTERLRESRASNVALTNEEAQTIAGLGKSLVSKSATLRSDSSDDERTVITCEPTIGGLWRVTVGNAIGAFGVGDITFIVEPKIPVDHLFYIFRKALVLPRFDNTPTALSHSEDLLELIASWFIQQTRLVIARDLIRDYQSVRGALSFARGQIDAMSTAERYYGGSLEIDCVHDEFSIDNAYNRLLLAALRSLQSTTALSDQIRRASRDLVNHFVNVGGLLPTDILVAVDRRSAYYDDALSLARLIISSNGMALETGSVRAWTFLIRTPDIIEAGIRKILEDGLKPEIAIRKYVTALEPNTMSISPDLRFDGANATGDVKYKIFDGQWPRSDLYQNVAFAVGAGAKRGCVVSFESGSSPLQWVRFKTIEVSNLVWDARVSTDPSQAAASLVEDCKRWINFEHASELA